MLKLDDLSIGDRVVLRFRLAPQEILDGGPTTSDALGEVLAVTDAIIRIETRKGATDVLRSEVTHAKRVPPPPARRERRQPTN